MLQAALVEAAASLHVETQGAGEEGIDSDDDGGDDESCGDEVADKARGDASAALTRVLARERALAGVVGWADGSGSDGGTQSPSASGKYDRVSRTWISPAPRFPATDCGNKTGPRDAGGAISGDAVGGTACKRQLDDETDSIELSVSGRDRDDTSAADATGVDADRLFTLEVAAHVSAELGWQAEQWRSALQPGAADSQATIDGTGGVIAPPSVSEAAAALLPNLPPQQQTGEVGGKGGGELTGAGGGGGKVSPASSLPSDEARAALLVIRASYLQVLQRPLRLQSKSQKVGVRRYSRAHPCPTMHERNCPWHRHSSARFSYFIMTSPAAAWLLLTYGCHYFYATGVWLSRRPARTARLHRRARDPRACRARRKPVLAPLRTTLLHPQPRSPDFPSGDGCTGRQRAQSTWSGTCVGTAASSV